jgi:uncharacterized RDD family membrane protein YckC
MAYTFKHGDQPLKGFTVQRAVGGGGFGEVYYAVSDGGREVALKYLRENPQVELRGVSHCINLKSPHLVSIFDVKKNGDGDYFVIMEYCSGPSLRDLLIAEPNGFAPEKAAFFVRELAKGLSYLHERGIVHRDLKPGNVFFDDGYVKIGDYGLSKFISVSRHSAQTASVGTVHYMAPEIGSGDYSRGVDIYALGVMLYEMLLGRVPFEGSSMAEVLMKHLTSQPEVDSLPAPFGKVIRKALEKDPKDRYQTVDEMIDELMAVEEVQKSLAGFSPQSLEGAVANRVKPPPPPPPVIPGAPGRRPGVPHPPFAQPVANVAIASVPVPGGVLRPAGAAFGGQPATVEAELSPEAASGRLYFAGFWIRVLASLIDTIVVVAATGLVTFFLATITGQLGAVMQGGNNPLFLAVAILYDGYLIGRWNGQTLGKKALGIKVISADGCQCSYWRAFARAGANWLNMFTLGLSYLMVAFTDKKRGLHDYVAGTLHVYAIQ